MGLKEYKFGFESENIAVKFLKSHGFEILECNFHSRFGEIDIIAKKDKILHFIEVKATSKNYETAYRITSSKFSKILKTIKFYITKNQNETDFQVDFIGINKEKISFIENISL